MKIPIYSKNWILTQLVWALKPYETIETFVYPWIIDMRYDTVERVNSISAGAVDPKLGSYQPNLIVPISTDWNNLINPTRINWEYFKTSDTALKSGERLFYIVTEDANDGRFTLKAQGENRVFAAETFIETIAHLIFSDIARFA